MALFTLWGCSPKEEVTVYVDCNGESIKRELSFLRGGKKILTFHPEFQIGFMKFLQKSSDGNSFRATFEFAESGDYKPFLLDLTGDGDKRYLILTEYLGGNDAFNYRGYLIDTKDNFAIIGEVPAGEICDYPTGNKEFIFTLSDSIAYFGVNGYATVSVNLKLAKGKEPQLVRGEWSKFSLEPYRKMLKDKYDKPYDIALFCLYGDLASRGEFSQAQSMPGSWVFLPKMQERSTLTALLR
jgi:hypothetical protein